MIRTKFLGLFVAIIMMTSLFGTASALTLTAVVDFEGVPVGTIVTSLSNGYGVSGDTFPGAIAVLGDNSAQHVVGNAAMIYDSVCGGAASGCSGGDTDLFAPNLGRTMIISEDLNGANPDDNAGGGWLDFNLSGFGPGIFTVSNANVVDLERGGRIDFFNNGNFITTVDLPSLSDGEQALVSFSVDNVTSYRVYIYESGAIDNIQLSYEEADPPPPPPPTGNEGCTPGYWRQEHHFDSWVGYAPTDLYSDVFGSGPAISLLDAVTARGNRNGEAYLRHSVAALLNASSADVAYPYTLADIIAGMYTKDQLEAANEAGCPLN